MLLLTIYLINYLLNKYIASFNYFKSLIVLSVTTGSISIAFLFATVIRAPVGMASASFSLAFSIFRGIVKKTVKNNKK